MSTHTHAETHLSPSSNTHTHTHTETHTHTHTPKSNKSQSNTNLLSQRLVDTKWLLVPKRTLTSPCREKEKLQTETQKQFLAHIARSQEIATRGGEKKCDASSFYEEPFSETMNTKNIGRSQPEDCEFFPQQRRVREVFSVANARSRRDSG